MSQLYAINSFHTFRSVPIPKRATIHHAVVRFTAKTAFGATNDDDDVNIMILGHDADDSSPPTDGSTAAGMTRTSACLNWDEIAHWSDDLTYDSPDVACILQEIVDRSGWAAGNDLTLFFEEYDSTSAGLVRTTRRSYDYSENSSKAAKLIVHWTQDEDGSGGLVLSGSATVSSGRFGTGGLILGGSAEVTGTSIEHPSGGLVLGGEALVNGREDRFGTGGLVLGGTAESEVYNPTEYPSGGLVLSGEAIVTMAYNEVGSGGLVIRSAPWLYRKVLTVPEGAIGEDFNKFYLPVATTIPGGSSTVMFTTTSGDTLAHEVRQFDAVTERLWAFVKLPLNADSDNNIFLYWGQN